MDKPVLFFDYDGVIIDSKQNTLDTLNLFFKKKRLDIKFSVNDLRKVFQGNFWENINIVLGGKSKITLNERNLFYNTKKEIQTPIVVFQDVLKVIKKIANDFKLIIVSSNHSKHIQKRLVDNNCDYYFYQILGCDHIGNKEEKFRDIIKSNKNQNNFYLVTDSVGDLLEAEKSNIKTIAVTWGIHNKEDFEKFNPFVIIDNFFDLEENIKKLVF